MKRKVLNLGQCAADNYAITRMLQGAWECDVVPAHNAAEATKLLRQQPFDLVLVNRIFDADGSSGLAFITRLKQDESLSKVPIMLVSNYPEAQQQAVTAGAVPGFGKAALDDPETLTGLRPYLETV